MLDVDFLSCARKESHEFPLYKLCVSAAIIETTLLTDGRLQFGCRPRGPVSPSHRLVVSTALPCHFDHATLSFRLYSLASFRPHFLVISTEGRNLVPLPPHRFLAVLEMTAITWNDKP